MSFVPLSVLDTVGAAASAVVSLVARAASDPVPDPNDVRPGWIALGVMVLMVIATFLLWMNMRKQIRKIDFDEEGTEPEGPSDGERADASPTNGDSTS